MTWRVVAFWLVLAAVCIFGVGYLVGVQRHATITEQNVVAGAPCPLLEDLAVSWNPDRAHDETREFMKICGYISTGTPLPHVTFPH